MLILTIKTNEPQAEVALYSNDQLLENTEWLAHRELAETIHDKIHDLLQNHKKNWHDVSGVVVYKGPGSFTGIRISLTVGNSLAANLGIPIVGTNDEQWQQTGIAKLLQNDNDTQVAAEYGRPAHITERKK